MFGGKMVKSWWALTTGKIEPVWIVARWLKSTDVCDTWTLCKNMSWENRRSWWRESKINYKKDGTNRGKWNDQNEWKMTNKNITWL